MRICVAILLLFHTPAMVHAESRVAFVVGNAAYENSTTLANPINDAELVSRTLEQIGFDVTLRTDLTRSGFGQALSVFLRETEGADVTFFYFAGHGMQFDGENYLLGTDFSLQSEFDLIADGLSLADITEAVQRRSNAALMFIDACRDNPFADRFFSEIAPQTRSGATRGLAPVLSSQSGTMLVFAASPGQVAYDGDGPNSPFSLALARHLPTPDVEVLTLMKRVIGDVRGLTRGLQNPTVTNDLALEVYLGLPEDPVPDPQEPEAEQVTSATLPRSQGSPLITACDAMAADPDDPDLPENVVGVLDDALEPGIAISACRIAVSGHPEDARSAYQLARAHLAGGESSLGLAEMQRAADLGYTIALTELGGVLIESAVDAEAAEGVRRLSDAARNGDGNAAMRVAEYFETNEARIAGADARAEEFFALAAEQGNVQAMFEVGYRLVSRTLSSDEDIRRGLDLLETAAADGHEEAMLRLANAYFLHERFADRGRAIFWLEGAASIGNEFAQRRLVSLALEGPAEDLDPERAARWTQMLADAGDPRAAVETGYNFEVGRGFEQDSAQAAEYYYQALRLGSDLPMRRVTADWPTETARAMQRILTTSWQYTGPNDGVIGTQSRESMDRLCDCELSVQDLRFSEEFSWD
jgi:TPR repeat protein